MRNPGSIGYQVLLALALLPACAGAAPPALTTVAAVRNLTYEQAAEGRPVDLKGIVDYYDPTLMDLFFQDQTGSIYVLMPHVSSVVAGSRVIIRGKTSAGYTTQIDPTEIRETGRGPLPEPKFVHYAEAVKHKNDCRFVTMEGLVRSSTRQWVDNARVHLLELEVDGHMVDAAISSDNKFDPTRLLDATVRITGNLGGDFDAHDQIVDLQLIVGAPSEVVLLNRPARNLGQIPVTSLSSLARSDRFMRSRERVRTQGALALYDAGERMVIKDGENTLLIQTRQMDPMKIGERVEVTGFPSSINSSPALEFAQVFARGEVTPLPARAISFADAMSGRYNYDLVALEGEVVSDTRESHLHTLTLRSGDQVFQAVYRKRVEDADPIPVYQPGTKVRVEGVCIVHFRGFWGAVESFQMHLRSQGDITVLALPSWWTVKHMLFLTSGLLGLVLLALGWGIWIRWRLTAHERLLRQKVELEAARLDTQARLERQRSHILELINSYEPLPKVFTAIHGYVAEMWPGVHAYSHVLRNRTLHLVAGAHLGDEEMARLRVVDPTHSPDACAVAVRTKELVSRPELPPVWARTLISSHGEILGTMTFEGEEGTPVRFNRNAFNFGCNLASIAIDNRRLYEAALHRSEHDQLTGLPNRVLVDARLEEALLNAGATGRSVAVLFLDLDDFKAVNDNYSHRIGDLYLCEVAHRFQGCLRERDVLGRVGGDEFVVVIAAGTNPALAREVAERLRRTMHAPCIIEGYTIQGSVSVGVAIAQNGEGSASELKHQADAAMYEAKRAGRNQVRFSETPAIAGQPVATG